LKNSLPEDAKRASARSRAVSRGRLDGLCSSTGAARPLMIDWQAENHFSTACEIELF
jgi:hypothetical protein